MSGCTLRAARLQVVLACLAAAGAVTVVGCRGKSPEESRTVLYESSVRLKEDSAATVAFFQTILGDSIQRERLARVILENEGMRRTMMLALIEDSLASVPGAGLPSWRPPPSSPDPAGPDTGRAPAVGATRGSITVPERRSDAQLREDPDGRNPETR